MRSTVGVFMFLFALSFSASASPAKGKTTTADGDGSSAAVKDRLPSKVDLKQAMGLAADILEQQRQKLIEERRRLEELKGEISSEIKRLSRLQKGMKNADTPPMPTVGTSMDELNQRSTEKLSKQEAAARKARVRHVAKSLAAMSPKAAAIAISRMNDRLAVELLSVVDGKKVGKIFEAMNAQRAAVLMQKVIDTRTVASTKSGGKKGSL